MSVESRISEALSVNDPLVRLQLLVEVARYVDELRSEVAHWKGQAAATCAAAGVTQRHMADATGVTPMMVQQWVKRGREST